MIRLGLFLLLSWPAAAQEPSAKPQEKPAQEQPLPPEEDESLKPAREYVFNPLQAKNELKIGAYYFKKGSMKAAALRFEEATRWDPTSADAFLKLGEARERMGDKKSAKAAYTKYLELAPEAKDAPLIRKKLKGS